MIHQKEIHLPPYKRGFHLITHIIEKAFPELPQTGIMNILIKHTSAGLTLNENADPSVRYDFENFFNTLVPEGHQVFTHDTEGQDDMPAHIKTSLTGAHLTVPISNGKLNLGVWQGIYLCEYRNKGGSRELVVSVYS